ncbi:hypothetical protein PoB_002920000 [Plakobranchus ocellatus]|uniref:Uncharacterized protein n=1 Tax=Plakobranchus ocellatus TaxID=259542 RepID=A0AAV4A3K1_9GAST|nr:hypothetical protein PoB_002920000 [Plakobranchus ocellatus]
METSDWLLSAFEEPALVEDHARESQQQPAFIEDIEKITNFSGSKTNERQQRKIENDQTAIKKITLNKATVQVVVCGWIVKSWGLIELEEFKDIKCGHGGMAGKILCLSPSLNIFTKRKALQQNLKHRRIKRLP